MRLFLSFLAAMLLAIPSAQAAGLRGRVIDSDGLPAPAGHRVLVQSLDGGASTAAVTDASGRFEAPDAAGRCAVMIFDPTTAPGALDVTAGDIDRPRAGRVVRVADGDGPAELEFRLAPKSPAAPTFNFTLYKGEYYNNKTTEMAADPILVPEQGVVGNINMELAAGGGTISGRITRESNGAGLPGLIVTAIGDASDILSFDRTDANGFYRITGIPADSFLVAVNVGFAAPDDDFIAEFYDDKVSSSQATLVHVTEGADTPNINMALTLGGSIAGRVTRDSNGAGVPFVLVTAQPVAGDEYRLAITDEQGNYEIPRLRAGNWKVGVNDFTDLLNEYYSNKPTFEMADPVTVVAGVTTPNINMSLAKGGSISGTVRAEGTLAPLPDLYVAAERTSDNLIRTGFTDEAGGYLIEGLPEGIYRVSVPEIGEWYNNVTEEEAASPVVVTLGLDTGNINFVGTPFGEACASPAEEVGAIRGVVTVQDGGPIGDADVYLYIDVLGTSFLFQTTSTNTLGEYAFECLTPADYKLECVPRFTNLVSEWYDDADEAGARPVEVVAGMTADNIDFALVAGATISGRITGAGNVPLPGLDVIARHVASGQLSSSFTANDGGYSISSSSEGGLRAGSYKVWVDSYSTADFSLVPVVLTRFEAVPLPEGNRLEWSTGRESNHAGFYLERADAADGSRVRLTERLLTGGPEYRYVDTGARPGHEAWYWLTAVDRGGREEQFGPIVVQSGAVAVRTRLLGPSANPVRGSGTIQWELARPGHVMLRIFDASGRWVRTLVDDARPAGPGSVAWDGRTAMGESAGAGLYFLRLETADGGDTGRMLFVK